MYKAFFNKSLIILLFYLWGCEVDPMSNIQYPDRVDDEVLQMFKTLDEISKEGVTVGFNADVYSLRIFSNEKWEISEKCPWIALKNYKGYKYTEIEFSCEGNVWESTRSAQFIITIPRTGKEYIIPLTQMKSDNPFVFEAPIVKLTTDNLKNEVSWEPQEGVDEFTIHCSTNAEFTDTIAVNSSSITGTQVEYIYDIYEDMTYDQYLMKKVLNTSVPGGGEEIIPIYYGEMWVRVSASISVDKDQDGVPEKVIASSEPVYIDGMFDSGTGSEGDPFLISNPNQLNNIRYITNQIVEGPIIGYYKQVGDIDFSDVDQFAMEDIGAKTTADGKVVSVFRGIYDGGDNTVSNITILSTRRGSGLFASLGECGVIKNMKIDKMLIKSDIDPSAFVGDVTGGAIIDNCHVANSVIIATNAQIIGCRAGGITARLIDGYINNCSVESCRITTTTPNGCKIGGIAGDMVKGSITNCVSRGACVYNSLEVGGIVGHVEPTKDVAGKIIISGCRNEASITSDPKLDPTADSKTPPLQPQYFGGVVGRFVIVDATDWTGLDYIFELNECINTGNLTSMSIDAHRFGGVIGEIIGAASKVYRCGNEGTLSLNNAFISGQSAGGVVGGIIPVPKETKPFSDSGHTARVEECYNTGEISIISSIPVTTQFPIGGIVGRAAFTNGAKIHVLNCYNTGNIKGIMNSVFANGYSTKLTTSVGGIIGSTGKCVETRIESCYNAGELTSDHMDYQVGVSAINISRGINGIIGIVERHNLPPKGKTLKKMFMGNCYSLEDAIYQTEGSYRTYSSQSTNMFKGGGVEAQKPLFNLSGTELSGDYSEAFKNVPMSDILSATWDISIWNTSTGSYPTLQWESAN